jgi:hypothetical protein
MLNRDSPIGKNRTEKRQLERSSTFLSAAFFEPAAEFNEGNEMLAIFIEILFGREEKSYVLASVQHSAP